MANESAIHKDLATKNDAACPIWPTLRLIDGYHYILDSQHLTREAAEIRLSKLRAIGDAAQVFESSTPKWNSHGDGYQPAFAAVYTVPKGKRVNLTDDSYTVDPRQAPKPSTSKAPAAKASPGKKISTRKPRKKAPAKKPAQKKAVKE